MSYELSRISVGEVGVKPGEVKLISTDGLDEITTPGYIQNNVNSPAYLIGLTANDVMDVIYSYNPAFNSGFSASHCHINISGGIITIYSNQDILKYNSSATPGEVKTMSDELVSTVSTSSGKLIALQGRTNIVGSTSTAEAMGINGLLVATGTIAGALNAGVLGELDFSAATITTGAVAPLWGDMGETITAGTYSALYGIAMTNNTAAIGNAQAYLKGGATNLLKLDDNNAVVGATYFVNAGTGASSWGAVAYAAASKVLKISVNGTDYWLPLKASNA